MCNFFVIEEMLVMIQSRRVAVGGLTGEKG